MFVFWKFFTAELKLARFAAVSVRQFVDWVCKRDLTASW